MNDKCPQKRTYLDWAATAIPHEYSGKCGPIFGNPSSQHSEGRAAREALEGARCRCASVLGVKPEQLYFTSGGTESNTLVLNSLLKKKWKGHLLYSAIEHPSIRENCRALEKMGIPAGIIGAEKDGRITEAKMSGTLEKFPDARFITIMAVNNETGSIMDLKALSHVIKAKSNTPVHFHSDMVQALGKVPIDLTGWNIDSASYSSHKLGGPFGIGLLYLKKPVEVLNSGGGQEGGIRPGTENTSGALKLADILEMRAKPETVKAESEKARERLKYLIGNLKKTKRCSLIPEDREEDDHRFSPWILQARISGIPGAVLTRALDDEGVSVSTGSACSSSSVERPVLAAMGIDEAGRLEGIRISQGWSTGFSDMDKFLSALEKVISFL
ncbi:MAG: aminotransferase class V-fold PLP-dependent enzyme [Treponema sp.]|nr:aminotransferase class V-fold PLP-dependent enzyme [Treponema sp.]